MRLKTLGDLNRIYNFQDTAILFEIFESRSALLQKLFKFNPKKCSSASSFSECVHRLKSKCKIVLPTDAEIVRVFEKTDMGGYSCINTFGNDFRNNIVNCKLDLLFDGLDEISSIKKFTNILQDTHYSEFFPVDLFKEQYIKEYKEKIEKSDRNDPFYF